MTSVSITCEPGIAEDLGRVFALRVFLQGLMVSLNNEVGAKDSVLARKLLRASPIRRKADGQ